MGNKLGAEKLLGYPFRKGPCKEKMSRRDFILRGVDVTSALVLTPTIFGLMTGRSQVASATTMWTGPDTLHNSLTTGLSAAALL